MLKRSLVFFLCLAMTGCASLERLKTCEKYTKIYDNGLNTEDVVSVAKKESYRELKQEISNALTAYGYTLVVFEDPRHGFIVVGKEDNEHISEIILKYSPGSDDYKSRLDLVKGSHDPATDLEVSNDIKAIAGQINNNPLDQP